jgi:hypothetical protein
VIIGSHTDEADPGSVKFTRPLFPYPAYAQYKGSGDVNDAKNFIAKR